MWRGQNARLFWEAPPPLPLCPTMMGYHLPCYYCVCRQAWAVSKAREHFRPVTVYETSVRWGAFSVSSSGCCMWLKLKWGLWGGWTAGGNCETSNFLCFCVLMISPDIMYILLSCYYIKGPCLLLGFLWFFLTLAVYCVHHIHDGSHAAVPAGEISGRPTRRHTAGGHA